MKYNHFAIAYLISKINFTLKFIRLFPFLKFVPHKDTKDARKECAWKWKITLLIWLCRYALCYYFVKFYYLIIYSSSTKKVQNILKKNIFFINKFFILIKITFTMLLILVFNVHQRVKTDIVGYIFDYKLFISR